MQPGLGGIDVCRQIRSFSDVPILMLTACEDDIEQVLGLESGADDYVHKPIEPRLLLARLRALLRRRHGSSNTGTPSRLMHGELLIDRMQREVHLHGQPVELGTTEFEILWLLASQPGQILSRMQQVSKVSVLDSQLTLVPLRSGSTSSGCGYGPMPSSPFSDCRVTLTPSGT